MKNQKGFSAVEALLIVLVIGLLGLAGWYVYNSNKKSSDVSTSAVSNNSAKTSKTELKTYTNTDYGFGFEYPQNWKISEKQEIDEEFGDKYITVSATSPNSTKIEFGGQIGDSGGKGGDCADEEANDTRTARTCATLDILSVEEINASPAKKLYLAKYRYKNPTMDDDKNTYYKYDISDTKSEKENGILVTTLDIGGIAFDTLKSTEDTGVHLSVSVSSEKVKNTDSNFFDGIVAKEAEPVLRSIKLL